MTPERWRQVTRIYGAVLTKAPDVRAAALLELCPDDEGLRKEVESLLADGSTDALRDQLLGEVASVLVDQDLSGRTLGPYRLESSIGAGGMGQVYRANDTRLHRTVAIKVLAPSLAHDAQFRARFDREAKAIAALNHAHICTLYDIGSSDGFDYLVMEYVEGETLSARLERGAFPFDQALTTAIQIAEALAAAHRQGIVHRDLKPGNVMLTKAGVKLLDFGLARLRGDAASARQAGPLSMLPTTPPAGPTRGAPLTVQGTILGTLQYMAPEQLEGKEADARTDIFAFGAIVYEMFTGKRAFSGTSQASLIGAIMHAEPPSMSADQPLTPLSLERIVRTCLAKDPDKRWQSAGDIATQLAWIAMPGSLDSATAAAAPRSRALFALGLAAALVVGVGSTWGFLTLRQTTGAKSAVVRFGVLPPGPQWGSNPSGSVPLAVSPDGRWVVFAARGENAAATSLWIRSLDSTEMRRLPGTEGSRYPFWSPDSKTVGFLTQNDLKKVDVDGGTAQKIGEVNQGAGATWSAGGTILVAGFEKGLYRTTDHGDPLTPVTLDPLPGTPRLPSFVDDHRFLFVTLPAEQSAPRAVYLGDLSSPKATLLVDGAQYAQYAAGHLLFVRGQTLFAQLFDPESGRLNGRPVRLAEPVGMSNIGSASYSASDTTLVHVGDPSGSRQIAWVDADGHFSDSILTPTTGNPQATDLSFDGSRLVTTRVDRTTGATSLWITEIDRRVDRPVGLGNNAIFSPNGQVIVAADPPAKLQRIDLNTSERELLPIPGWPTDWSSDGRFVILEQTIAKTQFDLFALDLETRQLRPLVQTAGNDGQGRLSPDQRWLAYSSDESGKSEIYVRPFDRPGEVLPISAGGASQPRWQHDGKVLFFLSASHVVTAVTFEASGDKPRIGVSRPLFQLNVSSDTGRVSPLFGIDYLPAKDGRFLVSSAVGPAVAQEMTVEVNWASALKP